MVRLRSLDTLHYSGVKVKMLSTVALILMSYCGAEVYLLYYFNKFFVVYYLLSRESAKQLNTLGKDTYRTVFEENITEKV